MHPFLFIKAMADNFLEEKRDEYEKRKAAWLKSKKFKKSSHRKNNIKEEADDFENQTSNQENEDDR